MIGPALPVFLGSFIY